MNNSTLRNGLAALALIGVAACSSNAGFTPAQPPVAGPPGLQSSPQGLRQPAQPPSQTQTSLAGAALSVAGSTVNLNEFASNDSRTARMLRHGRSIAHRRTPHLVAPPCNHGIQYSYSSTGSGQVNETLTYFYDSACTLPFDQYTLDTNYTSTGGTGTSTETLWDRTAHVTSFQSFALSFATGADGDLTNIQVQKVNDQGTSVYDSGFTCLFQTGNAVDCGNAVISTVQSSANAIMHPNNVLPTATPSAAPAPGEVGFAQTALGQYVTQNAHSNGWGNDPSGLQLQINGSAYAGANGALALQPGTAPAWLISGGNQVDTLTGTATIGFGGYQYGRGGWFVGKTRKANGFCGGQMTSISLTLTDSADGLTVSLASNNWGQLTGSVTQTGTGQSVATMTLDLSGNGTISYTGGTVDHVQNWVVID